MCAGQQTANVSVDDDVSWKAVGRETCDQFLCSLVRSLLVALSF